MKSINLPAEQRRRLKKAGAALLAAFGAGLFYAMLCAAGYAIPCVFHAVTGLYCPGCGISRMCLALLRFDFGSAFQYNAAALLTLPVFAAWGIYTLYGYLKTGTSRPTGAVKCLVWALTAFFLLFGVLRNLPGLSFLAPV